MKKILSLVVAFLLIGSLSAQNVARECVLFEVFTGVRCPYCPAAANAIAQMLDEGLAIAPVAIHTSAFSTDEFYTDETNARANFYGISSYPTLKADGITGVSGGGGASENMYSYYINYYNSRISTPSPFTIDLSYSYIDGSICQVTAVVNKVGECSAANLKVMIALTESHIARSWQGMSELNAVTRDLLPTQNGTAFTGESMTVTETFDMAGFSKENMHLVAWVQSFSTREVFQAVRLSLEPEQVAYDVALRGISSVTTKNCSGKVEPILTVKTFGTEVITSMGIEVSNESGNVIHTYNWTGNAENGETFNVNMPLFDIQGANILNFNIKSINGNDDSCTFDNYGSIAMESSGTYAGDFYAQVKTPTDPNNMYLTLVNTATEEVVEEWHFDQGAHAYKFYINIPTDDCYRLSVINPQGTGCGNGFALIKDAEDVTVMQFSSTMNPYKYRYSVEFNCNNVDVEEIASNVASVYPNPASECLNINCENISMVEIYNSIGQMVYSQSVNTDNLVIDITSFDEGLYIVNVKRTNGLDYSQRIVVKK